MKRLLSNIAIFIYVVTLFTNVSYGQGKVTATMNDEYKVIVGGHMITFPDDVKYLSYDNHIYVPLRFISENMGLVVDYNNEGKSIFITENLEKKKVEVEKYTKKIQELESKIEDLSKKNRDLSYELDVKKTVEKYQNLPIFYKDKGEYLVITLENISKDNDLNSTATYKFNIKNKSKRGVNIQVSSAKFTYDNNVLDSRIELDNMVSKDLYSTLGPDYEGDVVFSTDMIPEDVKFGTLTFDYKWVGSDELITVTMPVKFD